MQIIVNSLSFFGKRWDVCVQTKTRKTITASAKKAILKISFTANLDFFASHAMH